MNLPPIPEPIIAKSTLIEGGGIWGLFTAQSRCKPTAKPAEMLDLRKPHKCVTYTPMETTTQLIAHQKSGV